MMMCPTGKVSLLTGLAGKKIRFLSFWATKEMMCEGVYLRDFLPLHMKIPMSAEIVLDCGCSLIQLLWNCLSASNTLCNTLIALISSIPRLYQSCALNNKVVHMTLGKDLLGNR